jgi:hypothetical protein
MRESISVRSPSWQSTARATTIGDGLHSYREPCPLVGIVRSVLRAGKDTEIRLIRRCADLARLHERRVVAGETENSGQRLARSVGPRLAL